MATNSESSSRVCTAGSANEMKRCVFVWLLTPHWALHECTSSYLSAIGCPDGNVGVAAFRLKVRKQVHRRHTQAAILVHHLHANMQLAWHLLFQNPIIRWDRLCPNGASIWSTATSIESSATNNSENATAIMLCVLCQIVLLLSVAREAVGDAALRYKQAQTKLSVSALACTTSPTFSCSRPTRSRPPSRDTLRVVAAAGKHPWGWGQNNRENAVARTGAN